MSGPGQLKRMDVSGRAAELDRSTPTSRKRPLVVGAIILLLFILYNTHTIPTPEHSTVRHPWTSGHEDTTVTSPHPPVEVTDDNEMEEGDPEDDFPIAEAIYPLTPLKKQHDHDANDPHYSYIVVIASPAEFQSRRNLIRTNYFGLRDNLVPCMIHNTDVYYRFWIYGDPPSADTPERRQYETEKMEWDDMVEVHDMPFEQSAILDWAGALNMTFDYLIIQDIHTFMQLSAVIHDLDMGVIGANTPSPHTINPDAPFNIVWGRFDGTIEDKLATIIGSDAVKIACDNKAHINSFYTTQPHFLTRMYAYFRAMSDTLTQEVNAILGPEAAAEEQSRLIPDFIREEDGARRLIRWENNVESVQTVDCILTNVYQDREFLDLVNWVNLRPTPVCSHVKDSRQSMAVVTSSYIYDKCMEPSAGLAAANKRRYAQQHGYAFVARSPEFAQQAILGRKTVWGKIDAIEKTLPKYKWLFWLDMDAVIMNPNVSLEDLLTQLAKSYSGDFHRQIDLIVSRPRGDKMINAGVFLIRNSPWSFKFLRELQAMTPWYNQGPSYEQGAMWELLLQPDHREHVLLLDNDDHTFNTLPKRYIPGDFVVHFAPDKCPNDAVLKGLAAAEKIQQGVQVTVLDEA